MLKQGLAGYGRMEKKQLEICNYIRIRIEPDTTKLLKETFTEKVVFIKNVKN